MYKEVFTKAGMCKYLYEFQRSLIEIPSIANMPVSRKCKILVREAIPTIAFSVQLWKVNRKLTERSAWWRAQIVRKFSCNSILHIHCTEEYGKAWLDILGIYIYIFFLNYYRTLRLFEFGRVIASRSCIDPSFRTEAKWPLGYRISLKRWR